MQIPNRLKAIGDLIPDCANVGDIGADHGLLELYLFHKKPNCHVLAIENKKGPHDRLLKSVGCLNNVEVSLSDGTNAISKEQDTLVLAGMGGENIVSILNKNPSKLISITRIVIDAHSFIDEAREAIVNFGFEIESEQIVYEKRIYYVIISFKRNISHKIYSKDELEFGVFLPKDPLYNEFRNAKLKELNKVKTALEKLKKPSEKLAEVNDKIRRLTNYGQN